MPATLTKPVSYASKLCTLRLCIKMKHLPHKTMSGPIICNLIQNHKKAHWIFITCILLYFYVVSGREECLKQIILKSHPEEVPASFPSQFVSVSLINCARLSARPSTTLSVFGKSRLPSCTQEVFRRHGQGMDWQPFAPWAFQGKAGILTLEGISLIAKALHSPDFKKHQRGSLLFSALKPRMTIPDYLPPHIQTSLSTIQSKSWLFYHPAINPPPYNGHSINTESKTLTKCF